MFSTLRTHEASAKAGVTCQLCRGTGHTADKCANLQTLSGKKTQRDGEDEPEDDEQEGQDAKDEPVLYECSICEAGSQQSCTDVDEEECPHREERATAYVQYKRWERKKEKSKEEPAKKAAKSTASASASAAGGTRSATASATAAAPSPDRTKVTGKPDAAVSGSTKAVQAPFDKPEEILEMSEEQLRELNPKHVVGIPQVWTAWIKARPVNGANNRREAWKDLSEEIKKFYTLDKPSDQKISRLDIAGVTRVMESLNKVLDPSDGYGVQGEARRAAESIEYMANEIQAFHCAREHGWGVARAAASIEERQHLMLKTRATAITKAEKLEKEKAPAKAYVPSGKAASAAPASTAPKAEDGGGRGRGGGGRGKTRGRW